MRDVEPVPEGIARGLFARGLLLVVSDDLRASAAPPPPEGVVIEPFIGHDWARLATIADEAERRRFRVRASVGRTCLVAWERGRPLGYAWVSPAAEVAVEGLRLELPLGACFGWSLFVDPPARSRGIGAALAGARLLWAEADGYTAMWRLIAPDAALLLDAPPDIRDRSTLVGQLRFVRFLHWYRGALVPLAA